MEVSGVTQNALDYLKSKIITWEFLPNQKLNETILSVQLGISRPPLREAFRLLEQYHLVVSIPRKGCYVADVSFEDFKEIYQTREMIEEYAIDLIKENRKKHFPEMESAIAAEKDLQLAPDADQNQMLAHLDSFARFHHKLVESSENSWLIRFYETISYNLARYQFKYACIPGLTDDSYAAHDKILALIQTGQYAKAKALLRKHIRSFIELLQDSIPKRKEQDWNKVKSALNDY